MARRNSHTLDEARRMLEAWKECEYQLATGQAKHYRIGSREFTALDLPDIAERIRHYSNLVESLQGSGRTTRVVRIVPRDL